MYTRDLFLGLVDVASELPLEDIGKGENGRGSSSRDLPIAFAAFPPYDATR